MERMEQRVEAMIAGQAPETLWLLEHPPLYTAGTSAQEGDLLEHQRFPVYSSGRGGQYTYHGPGQRVAYLMLDLNQRTGNRPDLRQFVKYLELWLINTLAHFGVQSFVREGRVGVWTIDKRGQESKIAALGIRVKKWITFHGIALNVTPDLTHFQGIVPCGLRQFGVTSLADLGIDATMEEVDEQLIKEFLKLYPSTVSLAE
jgi:lipoyl(octanoyl) transferase